MPNPLRGVPSFLALGKEFIEASNFDQRQRDTFEAFCAGLDHLRDASTSAVNQTNITNILNAASDRISDNTPEKVVTIQDCTPQPDVAKGMAVFVDAAKNAYLAVATDTTRPCTGVVVSVRNMGRIGIKVDVQTHGPCQARVTDMIANEGQLWLSTTAGRLTNNYNQSGKVLNQECGTLTGFAVTDLNQTLATLANVSLSLSSASASSVV